MTLTPSRAGRLGEGHVSACAVAGGEPADPDAAAAAEESVEIVVADDVVADGVVAEVEAAVAEAGDLLEDEAEAPVAVGSAPD